MFIGEEVRIGARIKNYIISVYLNVCLSYFFNHITLSDHLIYYVKSLKNI